MKNLALTIASVCLCNYALAQTDTNRIKPYPTDINKEQNGTNRNYNSDRYSNDNPDSMRIQTQRLNHPDGFMVQNGKMVTYKNGKLSNVDKDITLSNGTTIMANGYYSKKGGSNMILKDGEQLDMMGTMIPQKQTNSDKQITK